MNSPSNPTGAVVATVPQAPALVTSASPELASALKSADRMLATATALVIDSPEMYEAAAEELVDARGRWKAIEAQRVHLKEPFLEGCKRIDDLFRVPLDRLAQSADVLKRGMVVFKDAEDKKADDARRAAEATARAEREEQERIQREAAAREQAARDEAARVAREAQQRADRERAEAADRQRAAEAAGNAEAAAAAQAEQAAAQERADAEAAQARVAAELVAAESQQAAEAAQVSMDLAEVAPTAVVPVSRAQASGVSGRKTWKVKGEVDKAALVKGAAEALARGDDSLLAYLLVDESALNKIAGALKAAARVPGVVFGEVTTLAATGRR